LREEGESKIRRKERKKELQLTCVKKEKNERGGKEYLPHRSVWGEICEHAMGKMSKKSREDQDNAILRRMKGSHRTNV